MIAALAALDRRPAPAAPSVDRALGIERKGYGSRWALAAIAAGAAGSALAIEAGQPRPTPEAERPEPVPTQRRRAAAARRAA